METKIFLLASIFLFTSATPAPTVAVATVVYHRSGCDYMILQDDQGYILAEWMGGKTPEEGDNIIGNMRSYGIREMYNGTRESCCSFYVDDYLLTKQGAIDKIKEHCNK